MILIYWILLKCLMILICFFQVSCRGLLIPEYFEFLKKKLKEGGSEFPFSDSPIIFFSIDQTIRWMKTVLKNNSLHDTFNFPNYRAIAKEVVDDAGKEAEKLIEDFNNEIDLTNLTVKQAEVKYISILENLRHQFNDSEDSVKEYFASLQREDDTEGMFELNVFFFDLDYRSEEHTSELQ